MTTLLDIIQQVCRREREEAKPTDIAIGTVTQVDPLAITLHSNMPPLPADVLLLTEAVMEKKINFAHTHDFSHNHTVPQVTNQPQPDAITDNGTLTGVKFNQEDIGDIDQDGSFSVVTPRLKVGDKVLLLRVMGGQQYVILSRVVEA